MFSWGTAFDKIRGILASEASQGSPLFEGTESVTSSGSQALVACESLTAEVLCYDGSGLSKVPSFGNAFGDTVSHLGSRGPVGALAEAAGLAAAGVRAAAFLPAGRLGEATELLIALTETRTPLVVHAVVGQGDGSLAALSQSGAMVFVARTVQHAVDLSVTARWVAERSLTPAVIAVDGLEIAESVQEYCPVSASLVRKFLGSPSDTIACPTASQELLFGPTRRRVPRWIDPDKPSAHGLVRLGADAAAAKVGQQTFFADHVADGVTEVAQHWQQLTGRSVAAVSSCHVDDARFLLIAQGAAAATAEGVVRTLRAQGGPKWGALALDCLRPFPTSQISEGLKQAKTALVLERSGRGLAHRAPLHTELSAALGDRTDRLLSVAFGAGGAPLSAEELTALCERVGSGEEVTSALHLGVVSPGVSSVFPKRQVLLQKLGQAYPELSKGSKGCKGSQSNKGSNDSGAVQQREPELPKSVRRVDKPRQRYDSLPHFWGNVVAPRLAGDAASAVADPYVTLGVAPPHTASLHQVEGRAEELPEIDRDACTGCGRCWVSCPDGAIAAVAVGSESLLSAAVGWAKASGRCKPEVVDKLQRATKQLAPKVDSLLSKSEATSLSTDLLRESYQWLVGKMGVADAERLDWNDAFEHTLTALKELPLAATRPLFHQRHKQSKGAGEHLLLAVNAKLCQGCGGCASVCEAKAISMEATTAEAQERSRRAITAWEKLPDTHGESIAKASDHPDVGPLAAALLSRHCLWAVEGQDGAEAGSGSRLAARMVMAVVELQRQRRALRQVKATEVVHEGLQQALHTALADGVAGADAAALRDAAKATGKAKASVTAFLQQLEARGSSATIDTGRLGRLASLAAELQQHRDDVAEGPDGLGRARAVAVVANDLQADWAIRYPSNSFGVPLWVDSTGSGLGVAAGLAEGLRRRCAEEARLHRLAKLTLENPPDFKAKARAIEEVTGQQLSAEEREHATPVLVFAGPSLLDDSGRAELSSLLRSDSPVKIVVLDDLARPGESADPAMLALAHRQALVASTSIAHPDHLFDGISRALAYSGPALIHIYAPSPQRHGFASQETVARAQKAVNCRVHPLFCYDPRRDGVFGTRLCLEGNPDLEVPWSKDAAGYPLTPVHWALGEQRFAPEFTPPGELGESTPVVEFLCLDRSARVGKQAVVAVAVGDSDSDGDGEVARAVSEDLIEAATACGERWATLLELAGQVTPFTAQVRERLEAELREAHAEAIEALKTNHQAELQALKQSQQAEAADQVQKRLTQLVNHGKQAGLSLPLAKDEVS